MRILFFSSVYPREDDPTRGLYCRHLCHAFRDVGHEVRVISPVSWLARLRGAGRKPPTPRVASVAGGGGVPVEYPRFYYPAGVMHNTHASFMWASVRRTLRRTLASFRPECVVSYWTHPDSAVAVRAAHEAGVPAVAMVGGSDVLVLANNPRRRRAILDVLRRADAVVTVGGNMRDALLNSGLSPARVHVVQRGVDSAIFQPGDRQESRRRLGLPATGKMLLFVGSLLPVKSPETLLDAVARVTSDEPCRLYLIGAGPLRESLEARAQSLGVADSVAFVGNVAQERLPDWYRAADITVLASRSEGIPNVLRESLACGTPFVATRVGGIPEIADERSCRLVPVDDPAAFAGAIREVWAAPPGQALIRQPSWRDSAEGLVRIIHSIPRAPQPPGHAGG